MRKPVIDTESSRAQSGGAKHKLVAGLAATMAASGLGSFPVTDASASAYGCSVVGGELGVTEYVCQDTRGESLHVDWSQAIFQKSGFWICNLRARFRVKTYDSSSYGYLYTSTQNNCQLTVASRTWYYDNYLADGSTICASVTNNYHSTWSGTQCHNIHK